MTNECPVCVQNMNKSTRLAVTCPDPGCAYKCCRACVKEYIVVNANDPKCMMCNKAYSRMFLQEIMPQTWIRQQFKESRENVLFERERSMIPDTMPWVEAETNARKAEAEISHMSDEISNLRARITELIGEMGARREIANRLRSGDISAAAKKQKFIVKCPDCPAFLGSDWKCPGCSTRVCQHCREKLVAPDGGTVDDVIVVDPDAEADADPEADADANANAMGRVYHRCCPDTLESAKMIKQDTRPCPKCGNPIHKISGCDQMFDPHCGTAFSWRTGQIVTGNIHNPHYMQWLREGGGDIPRAPGDILCGGVPGQQDMLRALRWVPAPANWNQVLKCRDPNSFYPNSEYQDERWYEFYNNIWGRYKLLSASRLIGHIEAVELPRLQTVWNVETNRHMRVRYVLNEVSETTYKETLASRERLMERDREIRQVYDTFVQVSGDILRNFVAQYGTGDAGEVAGDNGQGDNMQTVDELMGFPTERPLPPAIRSGNLTPDVQKYVDALTHCWWADRLTGESRLGNQYPCIRFNRRLVDPKTVVVPKGHVIVDVVEKLEQIETYCNREFCKISKVWKLCAPEISIEQDSCRPKRWHN